MPFFCILLLLNDFYYICIVKRVFVISVILFSVLLPASEKQQKPVAEQQLPFTFDDNLLQIDSLMQTDADSALMSLTSFRPTEGSGEISSTFNANYQSLLISEALFKTNNPHAPIQTAVRFFDSLYACYPNNDAFAMLSARSHYMNGVGFYENDSVVDACKEYLTTLDIMENHFEEKDLVGYKAKFMALTYGRLGELFSDQIMPEQTIYCYKKALHYCKIKSTSKYGVSIFLYKLGVEYDVLKQADTALYYYNLAKENLSDSNTRIYRDIVASTSLLLYSLDKNGDSIFPHLKRIIAQTDNEDEVVTRYISVGYIYYKEKAYDSAMYYFEKVFYKKKDFLSKCAPAEYLRNIYLYLGDTVKSYEYSAYLADNTSQQYDNYVNISRLASLFQNYFYKGQNDVTHSKRIVIILCTLFVLGIAIFVYIRLRTNKLLLESHNSAQKKRESLLSEPVCKDIFSMVGQLNLSARDNYYKYNISLSDDIITDLHSAVLKYSENFDAVLFSKCSDLNNNDLLICYLLLLGLNEKQIATLRHRTYYAIKKQVRKVEKQLDIKDNLSDYIISILYT